LDYLSFFIVELLRVPHVFWMLDFYQIYNL
jgi:hypothetical protein